MSFSDYTFRTIEVPESVGEKRKDDVLLFLCKKSTAYTSEIARQCNINIDILNQILYELLKDKLIDKIYPDPEYPQSPFKIRMPELWANGIISYGSISRLSWWTLTPEGFMYIKEKFKGKGIKISSCLVSYLNLIQEDGTV